MWQNAVPVCQHQVQPDTQFWISPRDLHRVVKMWCTHHQTGSTQDPLPMRNLYRVIDCRMKAKVVCRHDQAHGLFHPPAPPVWLMRLTLVRTQKLHELDAFA